MIRTIRIDGELVPDGVINRMKLIDQRIRENTDRKKNKAMCRKWWSLWFEINPQENKNESI